MRTIERRPLALLLVLAALGAASPAQAQEPRGDGFVAGEPLDLMENTRVFGSFHFAESCSYDAERDLYVAPNLGSRAEGRDDDGYVSLINPDGTVHTLKWIGVNRRGLTLDNPLGSDIAHGRLYVADGNHVRWFDMATGQPGGSVEVEGADGFNDIEVADDRTIYASQTGGDGTPERLYRIDPDGDASVFVDGAPLARPNGVAFDPDGNIVVVNVASADVLTFSPEGELLRTNGRWTPSTTGS